MANEVKAEIILDLDSLKAQLKTAEGDSEKAAKSIGNNIGGNIEKKMGEGFSSLGAHILGIASVIAGAFTLKAVIHAAVEAEDAVNSFNSALQVSGNFSVAASNSFQEYAKSLQKITTFGDDLIVQNAAVLASMGKLKGEGLEKATKAALDLSAGLNIDVSTAFNLIAKAATGNTEVLRRYGLKVKEVGDVNTDFASALKKVNDTFGGMAESKVNTFSGAMSQLKNNFGDVLEEIGLSITKSKFLEKVIITLSSYFSILAKKIEELVNGRDIIKELANVLLSVAKVIVQYVLPPIELLFNILKTGVLTIATLFVGLISILSLVAEGISKYLVKPIVDFLGGALGKLISLVDKDLGRSIETFVKESTSAVTEGFGTINQKADTVFEGLSAKTKESASKIYDFSATKASENFIAKTDEFINAAEPAANDGSKRLAKAFTDPLQGAWEYITLGFRSAFGQIALTSELFRAGLQTKLNSAFASFRDGFVNAFAAIGQAMVKGEDAFGAFGKVILGMFGDLAIQLGSFYLLLGLGNLFLNPAAAAGQIAAGIGLGILGGALKAMGSGGGATAGAAPAAAAGGGVAASTDGGIAPMSTETTAAAAIEKAPPSTSITVQVQGNILDRKETGLALAEVIQETFGSNGIVFATG